jgi:hypothetical protein
MRPEDLTDARVDEALRRLPRWEPPRHFVRAVLARMPAAVPAMPPPAPRGLPVVFRAATVGAVGASVTFAAGLLLSWATFALLPAAVTVTVAYEMFLEVATAALIDHATAIAWICAAVMLSIAASVTGRAREWI